MSATKLPRLAYSASATARMLGCSPQTVVKMARDGRIPSFEVDGVRRIWIPAWAIEKLVGSPEPEDAA